MLDGQVSDAVEAREGIVNTLDLPSILVKVKKYFKKITSGREKTVFNI